MSAVNQQKMATTSSFFFSDCAGVRRHDCTTTTIHPLAPTFLWHTSVGLAIFCLNEVAIVHDSVWFKFYLYNSLTQTDPHSHTPFTLLRILFFTSFAVTS